MIPLALLALQGQASYRVALDGGVDGTARITVARRPEGGKTVRSVIELRRGSQSLRFHFEATYDASGSPLRQTQDYGVPGKPPQRQTIVTFDEAGANAVVRELGASRVSRVPLAPRLSRANAAETWFLSAKPKIGETARAWTFDPDALEWTATETTYVGPTKGGHLLRIVRREKTSEAVVDDAGVPMRVTQGGMRLERARS